MVSRAGSIAAADVIVDGVSAFRAVSVYAAWETAARGKDDATPRHTGSCRICPRCLLAATSGNVAGDWNILHGYGESGDEYWKARYDSVFGRATALGLRFVGPQHPNGRQADPWPDELPRESLCVPTFHHSGQTPTTATRQLDFVFASNSLADRIDVCALNEPQEWGLSDHCRVVIDFRP